MPIDPYVAVAEALKNAGLAPRRTRPDQLIISLQEGPVWPNRGNSFWLSHAEGTWYLSTWLPVYYRIPPNQDVVSVCLACMAAGTSAMSRVPPEIAVRFELQEIDDRQYERLFPTEGDSD